MDKECPGLFCQRRTMPLEWPENFGMDEGGCTGGSLAPDVAVQKCRTPARMGKALPNIKCWRQV